MEPRYNPSIPWERERCPISDQFVDYAVEEHQLAEQQLDALLTLVQQQHRERMVLRRAQMAHVERTVRPLEARSRARMEKAATADTAAA